MNVKVLMALLFSGAMTASVFAFPSAVTQIGAGKTVELAASTALTSKVTDSGANKYGSFVNAPAGGTLKVTVPSGANKAVMWSALFVTNGVLVLDLTDVAAAGIPYYQHGGIITSYDGDEGALVVKGVNKLVCGDPQNNYERFQMRQVSFQNAAGEPIEGSVEFVNNFALLDVPTCAWSFDPSAVRLFALGAPHALDDRAVGGELAIDYNMHLIQNDLFDPSLTLKVAAGKALTTYFTHYGTPISYEPNTTTTASTSFFWSLNGYGDDEQVVSNDIVLAESASLKAGLRVVTFEGSVSGAAGSLIDITSSGDQNYCRTWFKGPVSVTTFRRQPTKSKAGAQFDVSFFDTFAGDLTITATNLVVSFSSQADVGALTGAADLPDDESSAYPVVLAKEGSSVSIAGSTGNWWLTVERPGTIVTYGGVPYRFDGVIRVLFHDGKPVAVPAELKIDVSAAGTLDLTDAPAGIPVRIAAEARAVYTLGIDPMLWLDAAAVGSVSNLYVDSAVVGHEDKVVPAVPYVTPDGRSLYWDTEPVDGHYPLTERWNDRRPERTENYAYQNRHRTNDKKLYAFVYPYRVLGGLNGMDYVSCATTNEANSSTRRMVFPSSIYPRCVVMVFGSQNGGGNAILGHSKLGRGGAPDETWKNRSYADPIYTNETINADVWLDGEKVADPTKTGFNGGWQVVTIDFKAQTGISGLGFREASKAQNEAGGQNYAEVLFFEKSLTDDQRVKVENYLARKWGLASSYKGVPPAAYAVNAYGDGEVVLDGVTVQASGAFSGKVTLANGATFEIPALNAIPTETEIAAIGGRVAWFDPDKADTLAFSTTQLYADCVVKMYDRALGVTTLDTEFVLASDKGRSPSVERRTAGFGRERTWLQYANVNPVESGANHGNALRMNTGATAYNSTITCASNQTVFLVQDSCQGGGCPILDSAINGSKIKRLSRKNSFDKDWTAPIWNSSAVSDYFAESVGGATYLNGAKVDGAIQGFTGAPEILTAVAGTSWGLSATGGYSYKDEPTEDDPHSDVGEIQGELLLYDHKVSEAERTLVESYLFYKWLGFLPAGSVYGDVSGVTVSGDGSVKVPSSAFLPKFEDFAGTVGFTEAADFAVTVGAAGTVAPVLDLPKVDLTGTTPKLTVAFPEGRPARGWYTVVTAAGGLDGAEWTFDLPDYVRTEVTATAIRVKVIGGFSVIVR